MSGASNIGWTNATWNPVRGCERVSEGCRNCYAEVLAARHSYEGGWGHEVAKFVTRPDGTREARWTGVLQTVEKALDAPLRWRKPRRVFVNSMSDLFHDRVPENFITEIFGLMAVAGAGDRVYPDDDRRFGKRWTGKAWVGGNGPHTFQVLTKRPERMRNLLNKSSFREAVASAAYRWAHNQRDAGYLADCISARENPVAAGRAGRSWPLSNVWLGVSVEHQAAADERIPLLLETPAAVRWISAEPLLSHVDVRVYMPNPLWNDLPSWMQPELNWVVVGAESGQDHRPMKMAHARSLIEQCRAAKVPVFVKQDNGPRPGMKGRFTDEEWALKEYPA